MPRTARALAVRASAARSLFLLVLACGASSAVAAQSGAVLPGVREFLRSERERQHVPGLSIAVVVDDQLVWSAGFGFADLESGALATGSTRYRIGSVSKPIVGTALMQLEERGAVDLDADVRTWVPAWPEKPWPIHVRHLMTHTSGIRHYRRFEFLSQRHFSDLEGPLAVFKDDDLLFEPGQKYSYSTYGFNLVANVIEGASGSGIGDYMREHVYEPAWMNDTGLEDTVAIQGGRARWYDSDENGAWVNAPYVDLSNKYAGGGITSTVEDLARFHIALARGRLLAPRTLERMYAPQVLADGTETGWGLAWRVREVELPNGHTTREVGHSGGSVGANTLFLRYPDQGFAVAVIANHRADLGVIVDGVKQRFFAPVGAPAASGR